MTAKRNKSAREVMVVPGTGTTQSPTRLTALALERVEALAQTGLSQNAIAALLGVGEDGWKTAMKQQPDAAEAFARGRAALERQLVATLVARAQKSDTCLIFALKNLHGWRSEGGIRGEEQRQAPLVQINLPDPRDRDEYLKLVTGRIVEPTDAD